MSIAKRIYAVQMEFGQEPRRASLVFFEAPHESLGGLVSDLRAFGIVAGAKIIYDPQGARCRIVRRIEYALGLAGVVSITNPLYEFFDGDP